LRHLEWITSYAPETTKNGPNTCFHGNTNMIDNRMILISKGTF